MRSETYNNGKAVIISMSYDEYEEIQNAILIAKARLSEKITNSGTRSTSAALSHVAQFDALNDLADKLRPVLRSK